MVDDGEKIEYLQQEGRAVRHATRLPPTPSTPAMRALYSHLLFTPLPQVRHALQFRTNSRWRANLWLWSHIFIILSVAVLGKGVNNLLKPWTGYSSSDAMSQASTRSTRTRTHAHAQHTRTQCGLSNTRRLTCVCVAGDESRAHLDARQQ